MGEWGIAHCFNQQGVDALFVKGTRQRRPHLA